MRAVGGPYAHVVILAAGYGVGHVGGALRAAYRSAVGVAVGVVAVPLIFKLRAVTRAGRADRQRCGLPLGEGSPGGLGDDGGRHDGVAGVAGVGSVSDGGRGGSAGGIGRGGLLRGGGIRRRAAGGVRGGCTAHADYRARGEHAGLAVRADEFAFHAPLIHAGGNVAEHERIRIQAGDAQPAEIAGRVLGKDGLCGVLADDAPHVAGRVVSARHERGGAAGINGLAGGVLRHLELAAVIGHGDDVGINDGAVLRAVRGHDADEVVHGAVVHGGNVGAGVRAADLLCVRTVGVHAVEPLISKLHAVAEVGTGRRDGKRRRLAACKADGAGLLGDDGRRHTGGSRRRHGDDRGDGRGRRSGRGADDIDVAHAGACRHRNAVDRTRGDAPYGVIGLGQELYAGRARLRDGAALRVPLIGDGGGVGVRRRIRGGNGKRIIFAGFAGHLGGKVVCDDDAAVRAGRGRHGKCKRHDESQRQNNT